MIRPLFPSDLFIADNAFNFCLACLFVPDVGFQAVTGGELLSTLLARVLEVVRVGNDVLPNYVVPKQSLTAECAVAAVAQETRFVSDVNMNGKALFNVAKVEEGRIRNKDLYVHRIFCFAFIGWNGNGLLRAGQLLQRCLVAI